MAVVNLRGRGKLLHDMGFSQVGFLEGGVQAWREAGFAVQSGNH